MTSPALLPRAEPTTAYITYTVTSPTTTYTTVLALGNSPATSTPAASSPTTPTNGTVIGAVVGSILGFIVLLLLLTCWIQSRNPDWAPYLGSSRSSFSSVYVHNPNVLPTIAATRDFSATTRVVRDTETRTFWFSRPSRSRRGTEAEMGESVGYTNSDTSASSESSRRS